MTDPNGPEQRLIADTVVASDPDDPVEECADWEASCWWRVTAPDGSLWCETSNEQEARSRMREGDTQRGDMADA